MKRKAMIYESLTLEKKHKFISPICKSPKIMMRKHFCSIFKILAIYKTTEIKMFWGKVHTPTPWLTILLVLVKSHVNQKLC